MIVETFQNLSTVSFPSFFSPPSSLAILSENENENENENEDRSRDRNYYCPRYENKVCCTAEY